MATIVAGIVSLEGDLELGKGGRQWFTTTCWTRLMVARDDDSPGAAEALEELCETYWYPLYVYIRRRGYNAADAEDLTQAYFKTLLEKRYLDEIDRAKGKFRTFLLVALNHFLANDRVWRNAAKRGGGKTFVSMDDEESFESRYLQEPVSELSPEKIYELRWARTVMDRALEALRRQYQSEEKERLFEQLKRFLTEEARPGEYAVEGGKLGMSSHAVTMAVHRMRQRYGDCIRAEIGRTVTDLSEVEGELRHLHGVLLER